MGNSPSHTRTTAIIVVGVSAGLLMALGFARTLTGHKKKVRHAVTNSSTRKANKPVLAFWKVHGYAQPIRLLLAYTKTDFEDRYYEGDNWAKEKNSLGLDFPNLPYYIDGDVHLTQSTAILRFLARKHNLDGTNEAEKVRIDLLSYQLEDLRGKWAKLVYSSVADFEAQKDVFINEVLYPHLKLINTFLQGHKWSAGENISFVDFVLYVLMLHLRLFDPGAVSKYEHIVDFMTRFEAIPELIEFKKKQGPIPINGPRSAFNVVV